MTDIAITDEPFAHAATTSDEARARSKAKRLNASRPCGLIRWEPSALEDGRWEVVAVREPAGRVGT